MRIYLHALLSSYFLLSGMISAESEIEGFKVESAKIIFGLSDGRISPPSPPVILPKYSIQKTKVYRKNGQKFIISRVVAPVMMPKPVKPPPTAEELEAAVVKMEKIIADYKPSGGFFSVGVTVYDHQISQLRFRHDGGNYEVFSNIDWGEFGGFLRFEGRGKEFTMMVFSGDTSTKSLKQEIRYGYRSSMPKFPPLPILDDAGPIYMVIKGDEKNEVVMEFLEAVHDLYAEEKQVLVAAYTERLKNDVIRRKQEDKLRKNPPPKPDIRINYWRRGHQAAKK